MNRRRWAATAALAVVALVSLWAASPIGAAEGDQLVVTVVQPPDAPPSSSSRVTVSGEVTGREDLGRLLLGSEIDSVTVKLLRDGDGSLIGEYDACRPCPVREARVPFFKDLPEVNVNGRYRVEVAAFKTVLAPGVADLKGTTRRTFGVAARPRPPQDVKVEVSPERVVTISWARNPEPDMLGYSVRRKGGNSETYVPAGTVGADAPSERVSLTDAVPSLVGGDFAYQVVAIRRGATPNSTVSSEPTNAETISVPAPPAGSATPGIGGTGLLGTFPPAQTASTARPRPLEAPDTGFSETLPFGARPPGELLEEGEEEAEPRNLEIGTTTTEFVARGRPLVPIAAGAILLLLAVHLRLLNKRIKSAPATVSGYAHSDPTPLDDHELDHGDAPYSPGQLRPVALNGARETFPAPAARAGLFDYEHEQPLRRLDDERWAPSSWDDDEVREVDREVRKVVASPSR